MSVARSKAWQTLAQHRETLGATVSNPVRSEDIARLKAFDLSVGGLRLNYAFQHVTEETIKLLIDLAHQQKVEEWRERMFAGDIINVTEKRAVLHTALRRKAHTPLLVDQNDIIPDIRATQNCLAAFVDDVREGKWTGVTGKPFRTVVNIGIGGSDLGPRLAAQALKPFVSGLDIHFVANVDATDIQAVLAQSHPAETLFVVVSKTFTTQETILNAQTARAWLIAELGEEAVAHHFVAVSVNRAAVEAFGIRPDHIFPMWDWVGGRYSVWSAVGLSVALAIGNNHFKDMLAGAEAMDAHFVGAPLAQNMPVLLAMLAIWNRNFLGAAALAILPYCERLRDFPRYLQQLEMESNGKSVTRTGAAVEYGTAPVIFGECGTVGQHSFHQCLHQGHDRIPADFIGVSQDDMNQPDHHHVLMSNMVAQMGALALGQPQAATSHDIYPGARSANLILLDRLDPYRLGMLLALYEHKTFVEGVIWEINSFDQPGVELGKRMAKNLDINTSKGDKSTADIVSHLYQSILAAKE